MIRFAYGLAIAGAACLALTMPAALAAIWIPQVTSQLFATAGVLLLCGLVLIVAAAGSDL